MLNAFLAARTSTTTQREQLAKARSYYLAFIAFGLTVASLGPTLPGLAEQTQSTISQIGILITLRSGGYMTGSLFLARLFDRIPGHPLMAGSLACMGLTLFLVPIVPLLWALVPVFLLLGVSEGVLDVGGNILIVRVFGREVGPFMNALHFFFGVGALIAPLIVERAINFTGVITPAYWTLAVIMLLAAFWVMQLPSPPLRITSPDEPIEKINYVMLGLIAFYFFLYVAIEISYANWIFTYAREIISATKQNAAYLTSCFWGAFTIGRLLSVPLAMRWRPRMILLATTLGGLVSSAAMLISSNSIVLWLGTVMIGLAMAPVFPTLLAFAENNMTISGKITGWFFVGGSLGGMSVPWLVGRLFESVNPRVLMWTLVVDLLITLALYAVLMLYLSSSRRPIFGENA